MEPIPDRRNWKVFHSSRLWLYLQTLDFSRNDCQEQTLGPLVSYEESSEWGPWSVSYKPKSFFTPATGPTARAWCMSCSQKTCYSFTAKSAMKVNLNWFQWNIASLCNTKNKHRENSSERAAERTIKSYQNKDWLFLTLIVVLKNTVLFIKIKDCAVNWFQWRSGILTIKVPYSSGF